MPLLLATDNGFFAVTSADQVIGALQPQVDGMRAAGYARSEILASEVAVINATSALYRGTFSSQRSDGAEINRLTATYRVTGGADGRRMSVLAVHSPSSTPRGSWRPATLQSGRTSTRCSEAMAA